VALNVVTDAGCEDQVDRLITVFPLPVAQFSLDPLIGQPPFTPDITNTSSGALDFLWTFDFGQTSSEFEPMHAFTDSGLVTIDLIVTNEFGCTDDFSQNILLTALQTDLVLLALDYEQSGEFISPIVTVRNLSNYRVDDFTIQAEIAEGTTLQEYYNIALAPDEIRQIDMNSSLFFAEGAGLPYLCVQLIPADNRSDLNPDDNRECIALGLPSEQIYWLDPAPNPVGSVLKLGLANAGEGVLRAEMYNVLGEEALNHSYNVGSSFVEEFTLDVSGLTPGRYILRLSLGLEEKTYRIQVLRN
jgi:PKD repeat protein